MKVRDALAAAAARLAETSDTPRLDAELLMAHALAVERDAMLLRLLDHRAPDGFATLAERRVGGEPVAYITGTRDFWTLRLEVTPAVLIPRPDSETLIEAAIAYFTGTGGPRSILDLGTGSGALLLAALDHWPDAHGVGVDSSEQALKVARANAERLGLDARARIVHGGWPGPRGPYDLILCNPPYVSIEAELPRDVADWEPPSALFSGTDGMDDYRVIASGLRPQLATGGLACIEVGAGQAAAAGALFDARGFTVAVRRDLGGHERCLILTG